MNITGHNHLPPGVSEKITADIEQWRNNILKNIDAAVEIIIGVSNIDSNRCAICGPYSTNWASESNLAVHYKYAHRPLTVDYYLQNIIQLTPEELREQMQTGDDKL